MTKRILNDKSIPVENNSPVPVRKGLYRNFIPVAQNKNETRLFDHVVQRGELNAKGFKPKPQIYEATTGRDSLFRQMHKLKRRIDRLKPFVRPDGAPNDNEQSRNARAKILKLEQYIADILEKLKHYHNKKVKQDQIQDDKRRREQSVQNCENVRLENGKLAKAQMQAYPDNWNGPTPGVLVKAPRNKTKRKLETENDIKIRDRFALKHNPNDLKAKIKLEKMDF